MTEREEFERWLGDRARTYKICPPHAWSWNGTYSDAVVKAMFEMWQAAYATGVKAERERAAKCADSMGNDFVMNGDTTHDGEVAADACFQCAAAIRRGE